MKRVYSLLKDTDGSVAATMIILMFVFGGFLAVVIDMAHVQTVKNELANAADAAALAGARALMPLTVPIGGSTSATDPLCGDAITAAQATLNKVNPGESAVTEQDAYIAEVITGHWDFIPDTVNKTAGTFTPNTSGVCNSNTNAVKVESRIDPSSNSGSVVVTLAQKLFGINVSPFAKAIAVIGYLNTLPEDSQGGFIGANDDFIRRLFDAGYPEGTKFYLIINSAGGQLDYAFADNAGWVAPVGTQPTPNYLNGVIADGTTFPMTAGETVANLSNGELTPVIMNIQNHTLPWDIVIPTFDTNAWNQNETVANFWDITITRAWKAGEKLPDDVLANLHPLADDNGKVKNQVGVIEFELHGMHEFSGPGGGGPPTNVYSTPRLVDNEALHNFTDY